MALVPYGFLREDRVLLVAGTAGLLLLVVALGLTALAGLWVALALRERTLEPVSLVVGHPGRTGFQLQMPFWLPLVDIRWEVEEPGVAHSLVARGQTLHEQWIPRRRGRHGTVVRWITAGDAFGLASIRFPVTHPCAITFLPDEGALRQVQVVRGLAAGDQLAHPEGSPRGDLQDIRAYGDGDPIRYVLWKVFAKSRTLVVRSPERALSPTRRTAAYLVAGPGDQAAAGTAKTAFECGALGDQWTFGADGSHELATERQHALALVLDSATCDARQSGAGLARFLAEADAPRRVVVFAPAVPGPWVDRVLAVARSTPVELILCADRVVPPSSRSFATLLLQPDEDELPGEVVVSRDALAELARRCTGVGALRVVDRRAGQVYGAAHLARLTGAA